MKDTKDKTESSSKCIAKCDDGWIEWRTENHLGKVTIEHRRCSFCNGEDNEQ